MKTTTQDYIFVGLQFVLFAGYVFEWLPRVKVPPAVTVSGMALAVLGLAIAVFSVINLNRSLTVFPTSKKGAELIESGLYRWVRHPIYTGIILLVFGFAAGIGSVHKLGIAICMLVLFYLKSTYEEKQLLKQYPNYADYRRRTGRFFPKLFKIFR
ncbi:MAG: isoprenylcysteine carboxylmethyltransferase family protein [Flavobacteriia bacterium]|nr:isoprenylcysteine carboxylmethyltransferase family protein [Flavobacteriia bacterium]